LKLRSPAVLFAIGVVVTVVLAVVTVMALLLTGDAKAVADNAPLIAVVIALGGVGTAQMVSIALENQRSRETRALEDRRTQAARDLEAQRAREAALQNYFKDVGELLIEKRLRRASPGDHLSTVVRAQTLSVLEGLDPDRKRILLLFLYESGLIHKDRPVVSLEAANLSGANLRGAFLRRVFLRRANLSGANLGGAFLRAANLNRANLHRANLSGTNLSGANLIGADLHRANLIRADLVGANVVDADLIGANLIGANLIEANLVGDLIGANLIDADLSDADLRGAVGITKEELERQAFSLEGATMPDGSKHS
jgi:uncharacterized protein YjbI with pentapeptide repeats